MRNTKVVMYPGQLFTDGGFKNFCDTISFLNMNTKEQFKNLKTELLSNGFLVSKEQEDNFCKENKLKLLRLSNGTILIGTYLGRNDSNYATVNFKFTRGSFDDPTDKNGLAHLYEHLVFSPEIMNLRNNFYVDINGSTGGLNTEFKLGGVYNPQFPTFGILGTLKIFLNSILNPNLDSEFFNNVKKTLISEYSLEERNFEYQAHKEFKKIIFDANNYGNYDIEQGSEALSRIKEEDVAGLLKNFGSKNLIVYFLYDGDEHGFLSLFDNLQQSLDKVENKGSSSKYFSDPIFYDLQNEKTFTSKTPQIYKGAYPLQNDKVKITKFTSLPLKYCSEIETQTNLIFGFLKESIHSFLREKGFSYRTNTSNYRGYGDYVIPFISTFEQKQNYEKQNSLFDELLADAFKFILKDEKSLKINLEAEKIRQKASPILQEDILDNAVDGLIDFNYSRNSQFIRDAKLSATYEMGMEFLKSLSKSQLHTFIYGEGVC